jgi:hypothetical protein
MMVGRYRFEQSVIRLEQSVTEIDLCVETHRLQPPSLQFKDMVLSLVTRFSQGLIGRSRVWAINK